MKTELWQRLFGELPHGQAGKLVLYDPTAQAGLWPFVLPREHWITHAAMFHDPWYDARPHPGCRAEGDVRFFDIALIDAAADIRRTRGSLLAELVDMERRLELCESHAAREQIESYIESYKERIDDLWEEEAERKEVAARCYLIVRGVIGKIAWDT